MCVCVCVELVMDDVCMVREKPKRRGPGRKGPADRALTGNIGQLTVGCKDGFTCKQTGLKRHRCKNRNECELVSVELAAVN